MRIRSEHDHRVVGPPSQAARAQAEVGDATGGVRGSGAIGRRDGDLQRRANARVGNGEILPVALEVHPVELRPFEALLVAALELGGVDGLVDGKGNLLERRDPGAVGAGDRPPCPAAGASAGASATGTLILRVLGRCPQHRRRRGILQVDRPGAVGDVLQQSLIRPARIRNFFALVQDVRRLGRTVRGHHPGLERVVVGLLDGRRDRVHDPGAVRRDARPPQAADPVVVLDGQCAPGRRREVGGERLCRWGGGSGPAGVFAAGCAANPDEAHDHEAVSEEANRAGASDRPCGRPSDRPCERPGGCLRGRRGGCPGSEEEVAVHEHGLRVLWGEGRREW